MKSVRHSSAAFTLLELLFAFVIVIVLAALCFVLTRPMREQALTMKDVANIRQILVGISAHAAQNDGVYYSKEQVGNSSWRQVDDPLSLCQVLEKAGMTAGKVWESPAGNPKHNQRYGNTYCWNRSTSFCGRPTAVVTKAVAVVWNNYCYTLPSVKDVVESSTSGGPRTAPQEYRYFAFGDRTSANFGYSDGSIESIQIVKTKTK